MSVVSVIILVMQSVDVDGESEFNVTVALYCVLSCLLPQDLFRRYLCACLLHISWYEFVECRAADLISSCLTFYAYLMTLFNFMLSSLQGCDVPACNVGLSEVFEQFICHCTSDSPLL